MSAIIKLNKNKIENIVKESYETIKKRLFSENSFIEITLEKGKITVAKSVVDYIKQQPKPEVKK
jgi:hypothetical protein